MGSQSSVKEILGELDKVSYVELLRKLIGESEYVQNSPPELLPEEDRVVGHLFDELVRYSTQSGGGPLILKHISYMPEKKRSNFIVEYPGTDPEKIVTFIGMHMDVVPANASDPKWVCFFQLILHPFLLMRKNFLLFGNNIL